MRRGLLLAAVLGVAAVTPAHARVETAGCRASSVAVKFDPHGTVTVTGDGRTLAVATFAERKVEAACSRPVSVSPPHTPKPIARRATVTCRVKRTLEIEAHPIIPAGSQVIVSERGSDTWLVTAVLKPGGSRVYVFSDACRVV